MHKMKLITCLILATVHAEESLWMGKSNINNEKTLHPYNYQQQEVHHFIEKICQTHTLVHSDLAQDVWVKFNIQKDGYTFTKRIKIEAHKSVRLAADEACRGLKILPGKGQHFEAFVNLVRDASQYKFVISSKEISYRPHFIQSADFKPTFLPASVNVDVSKNPLFLPYSPIYYLVNPPAIYRSTL
ncbi:hypothetical protein [Candidatus Odyssella thessalonicensis]|uniref:hypothetical protein n=1 Tax=Candidatus Odyssella thessalonicensis TaxID=84647 RepID=UPI000225ABE4|nr:hypothetical protein [Candidatus Odyssella thessalonicensis]